MFCFSFKVLSPQVYQNKASFVVKGLFTIIHQILLND